MNTIKTDFEMIKINENIINSKNIKVIALHFNNGYSVGITGIFDGKLESFYNDDFEQITDNYEVVYL